MSSVAPPNNIKMRKWKVEKKNLQDGYNEKMWQENVAPRIQCSVPSTLLLLQSLLICFPQIRHAFLDLISSLAFISLDIERTWT